jgi:S1-C subfamily serine protease
MGEMGCDDPQDRRSGRCHGVASGDEWDDTLGARLDPGRDIRSQRAFPRAYSVTGIQRDGETPFPQRSGTGFFISDTGYIVTALHVVGRRELFEQDLYDRVVGRKVKVEKLSPDLGLHTVTDNTRNVTLSPYADVALIKVREKPGGGTYDPTDAFNTCRPSGNIVALVWRNERPEAVRGEIKQVDETNTGGLVRFGPVAAHIEKGDSGGPVFDSEGRLIGVLSGRDLDSTDDAYFVPIAAGASLLFNVARIQPCYERDIPMATATAETLSRSISDMGGSCPWTWCRSCG